LLSIQKLKKKKKDNVDLKNLKGGSAWFSSGIKFSIQTTEGKIEAINYQTRAITLKITRCITGTVLLSSSKWTTKIRPSRGSTDQNSLVDVEWEVNLAPSESIEITYSYNTFYEMPKQYVTK